MAKGQFPISPVNGQEYTVNGKVFVCSFIGTTPVFTAKSGGFAVVQNIEQARLTPFVSGNTGLFVTGVISTGVGGAWFTWSPTSTAIDDGATVIKVTSVTTGRWIRVYDGVLDARSFGFPVTAGATTAMQNAATAANPNFSTQTIPFALPKNSELRVGDIRLGHGTGGTWGTGNNNNLMLGQFSLYNNTTGQSNIAVGYEAMDGNTTGSNNTTLGRSALRLNQTGSDSVAIGVDALKSSVNGRNTAVGRSAGDNLNLGSYNTLVGYKCLQQGFSIGLDSSASYNTFMGDNCATLLRNGNDNVAIGFQAMLAEPDNGVGSDASNNVFVGSAAGRDVLTASACVGIGRLGQVLNRSGVGHTSVGFNANSAITAGIGNTAVGYEALRDSTVGLNTAVGYLALAGNTTFSNCAALGANTAVTGSNQVQLGDSTTTTYVYGTVANRSDARDKADIQDTTLGLEFINKLRPVDYRWDMREDYIDTQTQRLSDAVRDGSKKRTRKHHGFIAQEVRDVMTETGHDFGGLQDHALSGGDDVLTLGYDEFIAPLVRAVQELTQRVKELEAQLNN